MGAHLGRYVMLKHLASGGMADVLLGRSDGVEGFERHVVLKRIRPELARDQRFIRMFLDEARVAATLHHQHIVQVHDIGEADGEYFIAMEYVHGEDVRRILSSASKHRTHVPLGYAVAIVAAAAAGLHYAHERTDSSKQPLNIVHRDVSPSNILVGYDGSIKVVDFGIATASMQQETRSGSLKGKLSYMSPEQCRGAVLDRRSDVYALGVVLYELATTARMIKGDNDYNVMEQIVSGRFTPPRSRRPDLPVELSEIILRALATDRDRRYATADELRIALDQFAARAGLVASTSVIAAYMHQQFGYRPEPWLELGAREIDDFNEEIAAPVDESLSSNGWSELPPSDVDPRRTGAMAALSRPMPVIARDPISEVVPRSSPTPTEPAPSSAPYPGRQPASAPPAPRRFAVPKEAMIGGALFLGAAIWLASGMLSSPSSKPATPPAVATAATTPAPPAPAAPPPAPAAARVVMPDLREMTVEPVRPAETARQAAVRGSEPARRSRGASTPSAAPATSTGRTATRTTEPAPSAGKPERPARLASISTTSGTSNDDVGLGLQRHDVAPPAPAPLAAPVVPAVIAQAAPPPPPSMAPQVVAPNALDAHRIAGQRNILPDEITMTAIGRSGNPTLASSYKVCVTAEGTVSSVSQLKSTGFPAYDAKIQATLRREWRYRPYLVNGKPTPVCTAFRFMYAQK